MGAPIRQVDKTSEMEKTRNELYALLSESVTKLGEGNNLRNMEFAFIGESRYSNREGLFY